MKIELLRNDKIQRTRYCTSDPVDVRRGGGELTRRRRDRAPAPRPPPASASAHRPPPSRTQSASRNHAQRSPRPRRNALNLLHLSPALAQALVERGDEAREVLQGFGPGASEPLRELGGPMLALPSFLTNPSISPISPKNST